MKIAQNEGLSEICIHFILTMFLISQINFHFFGGGENLGGERRVRLIFFILFS